MSHRFLTLAQAAEHVQVDANELKHVAQRGEIDATIRSGEWYFDHADLDEWAQRSMLEGSSGSFAKRDSAFRDKRRREHKNSLDLASLLCVEAVDLSIASKTKAGIIRDMTDLAERSGFVYDTAVLFKELTAREEVASTAIGAGAAFLHPRYHDPYFFEQSFIAYARSDRPIFFGAPDGAGTRHFFLICSVDDDQHLHILARLAALAHGTDILERLDGVATPEDVAVVVAECEGELNR